MRRMRSAAAPDMIVTAAPQNISWKKKKAPAILFCSEKSRKILSVPNQPPSLRPNMTPNPTPQNTTVVTQKSARFFAATLMLFFLRVRPLSRQRNPACIKSTRKLQKTIHRKSRSDPLWIKPASLHVEQTLTEVENCIQSWLPCNCVLDRSEFERLFRVLGSNRQYICPGVQY